MWHKSFSSVILFICGSIVLSYSNTYARINPAKDSTALIKLYEDTLARLQYEKIKSNTSDAYKLQANDRFCSLLKKALLIPGSFDYPFDSLKTLSRLTSPDKKFRILNWDIPKRDGSFTYYGFIQSYTNKKKSYAIYELKDKGAEIANPQATTCTSDNWFGMLYYKIIPDENEKDTYILLAWQGYSDLVTRKIIDVVSLSSEGVPSFGKAIFKKPPPGTKGIPKRILFQYASHLYMSLEYDDAKKRILFDRLSPPDPGLTGQYQYYGPSFQIDALHYNEKEKEWEYQENVDARNPADGNDKYYHPEGEDFKEKKKPLYVPH